MSFNNPTTVKVGMTGTFSEINYRVLGRVAMEVIDDGVAYYWNEFNLHADSGESATLVYEVTEHGGEWRWFTMFEPQFPITAADAAGKRLGDRLNLDGTDVQVTLRDHSRVYYIEGQAPEGVEVGDVAQYFNAETGKTMVVVSWTGEEVECYHGVTITSLIVARAFNLPPATLSEFTLSGTAPSNSSFPLAVVCGVLALVVVLALIPIFLPSHSPAVLRIAAPPAGLKVGSSGKIEGKNYNVVSDALVEINEVGVVFQRHEFHLRDEDGNGALLIRGWNPGGKEWCLFTLSEPSEPMAPQQAAAIQCGQTITADGDAAAVNALFNSTTLQVDTQDILQSTTGRVFYGFSAESGATLVLARWNDSVVALEKGHVLHVDPAAVFGVPAAK